MLNFSEVLDISEEGIAVQCSAPLEAGREIALCLDLAEVSGELVTTGRVIWSDSRSRSGLRFGELPVSSLLCLREWLFMNAISAVSDRPAMATENSRTDLKAQSSARYTDTLAALNRLQREVESLVSDFDAGLELIVRRSQELLRSSAAAIALITHESEVMVCRACSGSAAPPLGTKLDVGSGFSGQCVRSGKPLRCDDTETDGRVNAEQCRALGVRSLLAAPVRAGSQVVGLLEVFSAHPNSFADDDMAMLEGLTGVLLPLLNQMQHWANPAAPGSPAAGVGPTRVLLSTEDTDQLLETKTEASVALHSPVLLLVCAAAIFASALGFFALWIQRQVQSSGRLQVQTTQDSARSDSVVVPATSVAPLHVEDVDMAKLEQMADKGDSAAENALGLRYFEGDEKAGVRPDEKAAARWFTAAAENGNVAAQSKLGFLFWSGRGVVRDLNRAYFWAVVASKSADPSKQDPALSLARDLIKVLAYSDLTHVQAATIERQAELWRRRHKNSPNPILSHQEVAPESSEF